MNKITYLVITVICFSFIGILPMAVATSFGMETQQLLGIAVIFGLSISTVVTLVFIPVLYSLVNSLKRKIHALIAKLKVRFTDYDMNEEN